MSFTEDKPGSGTPQAARAARRGGYGFWSSWQGWALVAALGGSAGWLAGCSSRVPLNLPWPSAPGPAAMQPAPKEDLPVPPAGTPAAALPARNWDEYRLRAAVKLVESNPKLVYSGAVPEPLLAIPVIEIELHADGSIANLHVLRYPGQAKDTTQIALEAIRRAAPFGDVSRLPKPWKFAEVFLFDDDRKFKPRTLDQ